MEILQDYDLTKLNTLGISTNAKFFVELHKEADLIELFKLDVFKNNNKFFLGGGSNILFTKDFDGIVILNKLKGIEILGESGDYVLVRSMGGEVWHDLVTFCIERELWGIENLSLIPGTVGAAPVQNIGAYGAELKDILETVEGYEIDNENKKRIFTKEECNFGYRDSVFKNSLKGKYFISAITLKLSKKENKNKIEVKTPKDVSEAVSSIRRSKLPDPLIISNAGSFFKNIVLNKNTMLEKIEALQKDYPGMPYFIEGDESNFFKIPTAWLIEQTGWKGKRVGNVGVHDKQALVLVNYGGATGDEVKNLALEITTAVFNKFGLQLVMEVNLI